MLEAVVQDLRRHYGEHYRIVRAASGSAALDICRQLKERKEVVALFLSDQRMPGMTGVDFLQQAMKLYPDAKRVLLTAYADTEAAIRAINSAKIHYYLNKPWDPKRKSSTPSSTTSSRPGSRATGPPSTASVSSACAGPPSTIPSASSSATSASPYQWLTPEQDADTLKLLCDKGVDDSKLPIVLFGDGTTLVQPTSTGARREVGMRTQATQEFYDVIVIGAGPTGPRRRIQLYGASEGLGAPSR